MVLATNLLGCKQGEGQVCQIDDDCEEELECNAGTRRCQRPGSGSSVDAAVDTNTSAVLDHEVDPIEPGDDERAVDSW